ncbi:hypothetical protein [Synechococcus sp. B60.2]
MNYPTAQAGGVSPSALRRDFCLFFCPSCFMDPVYRVSVREAWR